MIALYLSTYDQSSIIFFPTILAVSGLVLQLYVLNKVATPETEDYLVSTDNPTKLATWTIVGVTGLSIISQLSPILTTPRMNLTGVDVLLYSVLIAIAEEQFFRGFLANLFGLKNHLIGSISSATVFAAYHLAINRADTGSLSYVFAAGLLLATIGFKHGKLDAPMLIHIINNVFAFTR